MGTRFITLTLKKTQSAVDDLEGLDAEVTDSFQVGPIKSLFEITCVVNRLNVFMY